MEQETEEPNMATTNPDQSDEDIPSDSSDYAGSYDVAGEFHLWYLHVSHFRLGIQKYFPNTFSPFRLPDGFAM